MTDVLIARAPADLEDWQANFYEWVEDQDGRPQVIGQSRTEVALGLNHATFSKSFDFAALTELARRDKFSVSIERRMGMTCLTATLL